MVKQGAKKLSKLLYAPTKRKVGELGGAKLTVVLKKLKKGRHQARAKREARQKERLLKTQKELVDGLENQGVLPKSKKAPPKRPAIKGSTKAAAAPAKACVARFAVACDTSQVLLQILKRAYPQLVELAITTNENQAFGRITPKSALRAAVQQGRRVLDNLLLEGGPSAPLPSVEVGVALEPRGDENAFFRLKHACVLLTQAVCLALQGAPAAEDVAVMNRKVLPQGFLLECYNTELAESLMESQREFQLLGTVPAVVCHESQWAKWAGKPYFACERAPGSVSCERLLPLLPLLEAPRSSGNHDNSEAEMEED